MIKRVPHNLRWAIPDDIYNKSHQVLAGMNDALFSFELMITQQLNVFSSFFKLLCPSRSVDSTTCRALKIVTHIHEKEVFVFPGIFLSVLKKLDFVRSFDTLSYYLIMVN